MDIREPLPPSVAHLNRKELAAMGRKKKLINNTNIPQCAIERFARCVFDDIREAYADEEIQREYAQWQSEQAAKKAELKLHTKKARAANTAALIVSFVRSLYFVHGSCKVRILKLLNINK